MRAMVTALSIMVATLVAGNGIDVHSNTDCPSSDAIRARLQPLLPESDTGDAASVERATPEHSGRPGLRVRLVRSDASVVADRGLAVQGTCEEMADTVATVLAAWESPQVLPAVATDDGAAPPASIVDESHARQREIALQPGAGGGVGFVGGGAATANLELRAGWSDSHLHARVAVAGQTHRESHLDPGSVSWRRTHGSLGLGWKSATTSASVPRWQASVDGGFQVAWLSVSGQGFAPGRHQDVVEFGAGAALRGERVFGAWSVWLEARASGWPRAQRAVVSDSALPTVQLPRYDVAATLGFSRLVFR